MAGDGGPSAQSKIIRAKTHRGRRELERRAPKLVEDPKRALIMFGNKTSQVIKDVMTDVHKLKGVDGLKYTRKNSEVRPFEAGGEAALESHCMRNNCSLFAVGSHSKKRPHNLLLGRLFDFRLLDMVELGVAAHRPIQAFGAGAAAAQLGNKPAFIFAGEAFETDPNLRLVRSLLLDFFRGRQVESVNLRGLDRVIFVARHPTSGLLLLRQFSVRLKRSGTRVPRVELAEMGPRLDLEVRRVQAAPPDVEKEACRQPKLGKKKKEKNVGSDELDGKVGHIYMPKQDVDGIALAKPKGLKRERRETAQTTAAAKKQKRTAAGAAPGGSGSGADLSGGLEVD